MLYEPEIKNPRVRIAPSPTGPLHIGTVRTALFNYLFAKKYGGEFILRIENTDLERSDSKWEKDIIDGLKWIGIDWDEGPIRQSERIEIYAKYLQKLIDDDKIYHCFCSEDELEAMRQEQMARGEAPKYSGRCRNLSKDEIEWRMAKGQKSIFRFKTENSKIVFKDIIRDDVEFDTSLMGDIAVAKDLATPLYNFAVVVDDFEMGITHVIRGEDHISNTPKQILLQEALGFPRPQYAHLPLILGPDKSKLSKRHGAVSLNEYKNEGYLPEAMLNFMAFLGWNPGIDKEIYSMEELISDFSLEKVQKSGAIFNVKRLEYINGVYIRQKRLDELVNLCLPHLKVENQKFDYVKKIIALYKDRLKKLSEIGELTDFFFKDVLEYNKELLRWKKMTDEEIYASLDEIEKLLLEIKERDWTKENLEKIIMPVAGSRGDRGEFLWPLRVALTSQDASAGPFDIAEILGREKVLKRIRDARDLWTK